MLSKEQAAAAADALIASANKNRVWRTPHVSLLLRSRALDAVEPEQRLALIQQASVNVRKSVAYRVLLGLGIVFVLALLLWLTLPDLRQALPGFSSAAARLALPVLLVMSVGSWVSIRREIARLSKAHRSVN